MLSYQHAYHAGNAADLHKHSVLVELLLALIAKPRAITVMETHAGRGLYDLSSAEARKTSEANFGILKAEGNSRYFDAVAACKAQHGPNFYPGSPWLTHHLLRENDHQILMELHPGEYAALKQNFKTTETHKRNGYEGVLALSPPKPRKGLVLIDPSYEVKSEYKTIPDFIKRLIAKWPEAIVLLWYPILPDQRHLPMIEALSRLSPLRHEVHYNTAAAHQMKASGLIMINGPYKSREIISRAMAPFSDLLFPVKPEK